MNLRILTHKASEHQQPLCMCFVDFKKAFDSISHHKLWVTMIDMGYHLQSWSKEGTVRHCQSKEASILWSQHEETKELPGERDNARNNARCTQVRKTTHGLDGPHQYVDRTPRERVNQNEDRDKSQINQRTEINGESTSMVWPTLGSRTAKEQNRTEHLHCFIEISRGKADRHTDRRR